MALRLVCDEKDAIAQARPNLMPFHIAYDGPAPISTYFPVKEISVSDPSSSTDTDSSFTKLKRQYESSFRGRRMEGIEVALPAGYHGLLLRADPLPGQETRSDMFNAIHKRKRDEAAAARDEELKRQRSGTESQGRAGTRRTRGQQAKTEPLPSFSMEEDDLYAMMTEAVDPLEEERLATAGASEIMGLNGDEPEQYRNLTVTGKFDRLLIWNPDFRLDEGKDEYVRSMDEWTRLAQIVRC